MVTIVLLTYRNPEHLKRALSFYKKMIPQAKVVVVDSNKEEDKKYTRSFVQAISDTSYSPVHLEFDPSTSFAQKVAGCLDALTTPYTLIAGDDDFFSPHAITEAATFLKNHPDYSFFYGYQYGFSFQGGMVDWFCSGYYENPRSFEQNNPLERLNSFLTSNIGLFYMVLRTDKFRECVMSSYRYAPCLVFFDNMFGMQALIRGKGHFSAEPFYFKEMSDLATSVTYNVTWLLGKDFEKHKRMLEQGLAESFRESVGLSEADAMREAVRASNAFIDGVFESFCLEPRELPFLARQKMRIKALAPQFVKKAIVEFMSTVRNRKIDAGQHYLFDETSPYSLEFKEITKAIKGSHVEATRGGFEDTWRLIRC